MIDIDGPTAAGGIRRETRLSIGSRHRKSLALTVGIFHSLERLGLIAALSIPEWKSLFWPVSEAALISEGHPRRTEGHVVRNLLRQPFLEQYYKPRAFPTADFLHSNAFLVGNSKFVGMGKMATLETLLRDFTGHA